MQLSIAGQQKCPSDWLESDHCARHATNAEKLAKQCRRKKRRRKVGACGWKKRWAWHCRRGLLAGYKGAAADGQPALTAGEPDALPWRLPGEMIVQGAGGTRPVPVTGEADVALDERLEKSGVQAENAVDFFRPDPIRRSIFSIRPLVSPWNLLGR